jgi:hypothetical protein
MQIVAPTDDALLDPINRIAEAHRHELGFPTRASFVESVPRKELLVALLDGRPVGFTRFITPAGEPRRFENWPRQRRRADVGWGAH